MSDSKALNPVSGKSHSNKVRRVRPAWVFKQAGKLIAENKDKGMHSNDEEEPAVGQ